MLHLTYKGCTLRDPRAGGGVTIARSHSSRPVAFCLTSLVFRLAQGSRQGVVAPRPSHGIYPHGIVRDIETSKLSRVAQCVHTQSVSLETLLFGPNRDPTALGEGIKWVDVGDSMFFSLLLLPTLL